ncbi:ABC transporter substrate-binding protein [Evansella tamaricis]|uniref:ABC transporter substrate-binding protein n=1 Tax=Evansella tamaricis TaxID=2069301 RepID=A0ABS6JAG6_9BACI|nr:ABC transporter substrate-binding protein [Evansella tamaricis]MBU9710676.1 ABC transporter substrate-binding protein [Evansella tamaricis]
MKKLVSILVLMLLISFAVGCSNEAEGNVSEKDNDTTNESSEDQTKEEEKQEEIAQDPTEITLYFPVAVGGPITELINTMADDFNAEQDAYIVNPIYTGSYGETMTKAQTAMRSGDQPHLTVLSSTELFALLESDMIIALDDLIEESGGDDYLNDFYYGFLENGQTEGSTYSIPFQRSTQILFYNKEAFEAAGLDPETPPTTWDEIVEYGKLLTTDDQWGYEIPSTSFVAWLFQGLALQNGKNLMSSDGTEVYFDTPENVEALEFWRDLASVHGIMQDPVIDWATSPTSFLEGQTAMMVHTTGNLANIRDNASFEFGTAYLPAGNRDHGTPVGGGSFYIFNGISEEEERGAWEFIKYATSPDVMAQWSIDTGYVGATESSYETEIMKAYLEEFPQAATARDQLEHAHASISTYHNAEIQQILSDFVQAALLGEMTAEEALKAAQEQADQLLAPYKQ